MAHGGSPERVHRVMVADQTYLEGLFLVIRASIVRLADEDILRPDPAERRHAEEVLKLLFNGRELHDHESNEDDALAAELKEAKRLTDGKHLLRVCEGDWSSNHVYL